MNLNRGVVFIFPFFELRQPVYSSTNKAFKWQDESRTPFSEQVFRFLIARISVITRMRVIYLNHDTFLIFDYF